MSLFKNKRDGELPLLTKVYQLKLEDESEVAEFCRMEFISQDSALPPNVEEDTLAEITRLCLLAYNAMNEIHGSGGLSPKTLGELRRFIARYPHVYTLDFDAGAHKGDINDCVPFSDLYEVPLKERVDTGQIKILEALRTLVWLEWRHNSIHKNGDGLGLLGKCETCDSIFQKSRNGQRWCSWRCRHREADRRRRGNTPEMSVTEEDQWLAKQIGMEPEAVARHRERGPKHYTLIEDKTSVTSIVD